MSNLQLSLAISGAIVLVLLIAYNAWVYRRNAPRKAQPAPPPPAVARHEPALDAGLGGGRDPSGEPAEPVLPVEAVAQRQMQPERRVGTGILDPLIDVIAPIHTEHPVLGEAAQAAMPSTRRVGSKPFSIEAWNEPQQQWETPVSGRHYRQFQAGVQMANRHGALNEIEFSEFVFKTQEFADLLNAAVDFPDMLQEVARARELDQFASDHDAQLAFLLRARQAAWSTGYIQQVAAQHGLVPGGLPGRLILAGDQPGQAPILTLAFDGQAAMSDDPEHSAIRDVSLSIDVAHVPRHQQPFVRLCTLAEELSREMEAVLCDQNGQPIAPASLPAIAADLEGLYDQLDQRELSAGSPLARRLFS